MRLLHFLAPPTFQDEGRTTLARQLWCLLLGLIGIFTLGPVLLSLVLPEALPRWIALGAGMNAFLLVALVLTRRGRPRIAAVALLVVVLLVATLTAVTAGGLRSPAAMSYLLIVPLAAILLGRNAARLTGAASALCTVGLLALEGAGLLPPASVQHTPASYLVIMTGLLAFFLLTHELSAGTVEAARRRLSASMAGQKDAAEALRTSEQRLSFALEAVNDGLFDLNLQTGEAYCSPRYFTMLGYRADELPASVETWKRLLHPDDAARALAEVAGYVEGRIERHEFQLRLRAKDGSWRWILSRGRLAERTADGRPLRLIGTHVDVTEARRSEDALREAEQRLRAIVEHSTNLFYLHTPDHVLRYVSPQSLTLFDCEPEEARVRWTEFLTDHPDNALGLQRTRAAIETGRPQPPYELELRTKKGRTVWVEVHEAPVVKDGATVAVAGSLTDITERKRAEAAVRASEERYRHLFNSGNDAIFIISVNGRMPGDCTQVNDVACQLLGYKREELLRLGPLQLGTPETVAGSGEVLARVMRDHQVMFEAVLRHREGRHIPVEVSARLFELSGRPMIYCIVRDLTERKRLEEQLRHSQKMEIFGQLASGVAHDFNNLLVVINGNAELLLHDTTLGTREREQIEQVHDAGRRAAALTKQLLLFGRKQPPQPTLADLGGIVTNHVKLLRRIIGEDINLALEFTPVPLPVRVDVNMLEQVVMNLAVNARDAMPSGGQLALRTARAELSGEAALDAACRPGSYAALHVRDSGSGIAPEVQPFIFDPFFTTKEAGKGTGLGLSTVLAIVQQHGGGVAFSSSPGLGTEFIVYLPIEDTESEPADPTATGAGVAVGRAATVLLAEDEDSVRTTTARILRSKGLQVIETRSGSEALARLREPGLSVDIVLSDIVMPGGVDGLRLARELSTLRPELPVVLMTGYTRDLQLIDRPVIHKPFSIDLLFSTLQAELERRRV